MILRRIILTTFLVLVFANLIQGGFLPGFIDTLSLPKVGQYSHNIASSSANAAATALQGFRNYFDNYYTGVNEPNLNRPKFLILRRLIGAEPSSGGIIGNPAGAALNAAAAASSAASAISNAGNGLNALGGLSKILPTRSVSPTDGKSFRKR